MKRRLQAHIETDEERDRKTDKQRGGSGRGMERYRDGHKTIIFTVNRFASRALLSSLQPARDNRIKWGKFSHINVSDEAKSLNKIGMLIVCQKLLFVLRITVP